MIHDICYADESCDEIRVTAVSVLQGGTLLLTFSTGEKRLFDTTQLKGSAFTPLKQDEILRSVTLFHGIPTWMDGEIDIAPETLYEMSKPLESCENSKE